MRRALLALPVLLLVALFWTTPARAAVYNVDPVYDPLGDCSSAQSADECMAMSTTTKCTDAYGCPQCGMNQQMTGAVCYRVPGNWGVCSCQAAGTYVDRWGQTMPKCYVSGSCTSR